MGQSNIEISNVFSEWYCIFLSAEPLEMLCEQTEHLKIIEKGRPDDVVVGIKNCHVSYGIRGRARGRRTRC